MKEFPEFIDWLAGKPWNEHMEMYNGFKDEDCRRFGKALTFEKWLVHQWEVERESFNESSKTGGINIITYEYDDGGDMIEESAKETFVSVINQAIHDGLFAKIAREYFNDDEHKDKMTLAICDELNRLILPYIEKKIAELK